MWCSLYLASLLWTLSTAGAVVAPPPLAPEKNWAGTVSYEQFPIFRPKTTAEVVEIVAQYNKIRVIGTRHSFNNLTRIDPTTPKGQGAYVSTVNMNEILSFSKKSERVVVQPGVTYGKLGTYLRERGFAVSNMASLPHITVGGAISTATHGAGVLHGNLATQVMAFTVVLASGEIVEYRRGQNGGKPFRHGIVSFGLVGVIVEIELDIVYAFDVTQCIYTNLPLDLTDRADYQAAFASAYSFSMFTQWDEAVGFTSVWGKYKMDKGRYGENEATSFSCPTMYEQSASKTKVHPLPGEDGESSCSGPPGAGPSHIELPHFLEEATPSKGSELQSEFFVPFTQYQAALNAMFALRKRMPMLSQYLIVSELRFVDADRFTLSPTGVLGQSIGFHFTWKKDLDNVVLLLKEVERTLHPFRVLPHFGKVFTMSGSDLESVYGRKRLREFQSFVAPLDPTRKFVNQFLADKILLPTMTSEL
jgi:alditol oxidase